MNEEQRKIIAKQYLEATFGKSSQLDAAQAARVAIVLRDEKIISRQKESLGHILEALSTLIQRAIDANDFSFCLPLLVSGPYSDGAKSVDRIEDLLILGYEHKDAFIRYIEKALENVGASDQPKRALHGLKEAEQNEILFLRKAVDFSKAVAQDTAWQLRALDQASEMKIEAISRRSMRAILEPEPHCQDISHLFSHNLSSVDKETQRKIDDISALTAREVAGFLARWYHLPWHWEEGPNQLAKALLESSESKLVLFDAIKLLLQEHPASTWVCSIAPICALIKCGFHEARSLFVEASKKVFRFSEEDDNRPLEIQLYEKLHRYYYLFLYRQRPLVSDRQLSWVASHQSARIAKHASENGWNLAGMAAYVDELFQEQLLKNSLIGRAPNHQLLGEHLTHHNNRFWSALSIALIEEAHAEDVAVELLNESGYGDGIYTLLRSMTTYLGPPSGQQSDEQDFWFSHLWQSPKATWAEYLSETDLKQWINARSDVVERLHDSDTILDYIGKLGKLDELETAATLARFRGMLWRFEISLSEISSVIFADNWISTQLPELDIVALEQLCDALLLLPGQAPTQEVIQLCNWPAKCIESGLLEEEGATALTYLATFLAVKYRIVSGVRALRRKEDVLSVIDRLAASRDGLTRPVDSWIGGTRRAISSLT